MSENKCQPIIDFYKQYITTSTMETTGVFGGKHFSTTFSKESDVYNVTCIHGLKTLNTVYVHIRNRNSQSSSIANKKIAKIDSDGKYLLTDIFGIESKVNLPKPDHLNNTCGKFTKLMNQR